MTGAQTTRVVSLQIGLLVFIGLWVVLRSTGTPIGAIGFGVGGFLLGLAIMVRARRTDTGRTIASVFVPLIAIVFLAGIGLTALETISVITQTDAAVREIARIAIRDFGLSIATGLAVLGAVGTAEQGIGDEGVSRLVFSAFGTAVIVLIILGGFIYLRSAIVTSADIPTIHLAPLTEPFLNPDNPGAALVVNWTLLIITAMLGRAALSSIPVVELSPRRYEDQIQRVIRWLGSWLAIVAILTAIAGVITYLAFSPNPGSEVPFVESMRQTLGAERMGTILELFGTDRLRMGLLTASGVFLVVTTVFRGLQYVTGSITTNLRLLLPSVIGGLTTFVLAFALQSSVVSLVQRLPPEPRNMAIEGIEMVGPLGSVISVFAASILVLILGLFLFSFAGGIRYIPRRGAGGSLAATGLGIGAIVLGLVGRSPFMVFALIALSIVVWNIGQRGVTTRMELDTSPPLTLETLHSLGSFVAAVPAIGLAWFLYTDTFTTLAFIDGTLVGVVVSLAVLSVLIGEING